MAPLQKRGFSGGSPTSTPPPHHQHLAAPIRLEVQYLTIMGGGDAWRPSTQPERLAAIGLNRTGGTALKHMELYPTTVKSQIVNRSGARRKKEEFTAELLASLEPNEDDFRPLGTPRRGDWLAGRNDLGQTFDEFARHNTQRQPRLGSKIYLLPVTDDAPQQPPSAEQVAAAQARLEAAQKEKDATSMTDLDVSLSKLIGISSRVACYEAEVNEMERLVAEYPGKLKRWESGPDTSSFPDLETMREMVEAFFSMPTVILEPMTMKQLGKGITTRDGRRAKKRSSFTQFDATDILRQLQKHKPHDAHTLCAVTMLDIYKGGFNFLFGLGSLQSGVGVFSFCRHDPGSICCDEWNGLSPAGTRGPGDEETLIRRASATLCHELGHTFGLRHCVYYQCLMQGTSGLFESERRARHSGAPAALCPVCLRKMCWSGKIDRCFLDLAACKRSPQKTSPLQSASLLLSTTNGCVSTSSNTRVATPAR